MEDLCRLLKHCQLRFFHFEEGLQPIHNAEGYGGQVLSFGQNHIYHLLPYLHKQRELETLVLISPQIHRYYKSKQICANAWPNLKVLYLREEPRNWLEHLPRLENLQVLTIRHIHTPNTTATLKAISKCRNLRILNLQLQDLAEPERLVEIADGCPLLRKFHVQFDLTWGEDEQNAHRDVFLDLLLVLPNIQFLDLGLRFSLDDSILRSLARSCPDLISFRLCYSSLLLSPPLMNRVDPFRSLQFLHLGHVSFEAPEEILTSDEILTITAEWPRIFPKLRGASLPTTHRLATHMSTVHYDRDQREAGFERFERGNPTWRHGPVAGDDEYMNYPGPPPFDSEDEDSEDEHLESEGSSSENLTSEDSSSERAESETLRLNDLEDGDDEFSDYVERMLMRHASEEDSQSVDMSGPAMEGIMPSIEGGREEMTDVVKDEALSPRLAPTSAAPDTRTVKRLIRNYLWKTLGFDRDLALQNQWTLSRLWQMNMEVEISGWPVVSLYAFNNPMAYSSSFRPNHASAEEYEPKPSLSG